MGNLSSVIPPAVRKAGPFRQALVGHGHRLCDLEQGPDASSHQWYGNEARDSKSPLLGIQDRGAHELTLMDFKHRLIKH